MTLADYMMTFTKNQQRYECKDGDDDTRPEWKWRKAYKSRKRISLLSIFPFLLFCFISHTHVLFSCVHSFIQINLKLLDGQQTIQSNKMRNIIWSLINKYTEIHWIVLRHPNWPLPLISQHHWRRQQQPNLIKFTVLKLRTFLMVPLSVFTTFPHTQKNSGESIAFSQIFEIL